MARKSLIPEDSHEISTANPTNQDEHQTKEEIIINLHVEECLNTNNDKHKKLAHCIISSNYKGDYILFISIGSSIKFYNVINGSFIGGIDGAHYKGALNFGLVINSGLVNENYLKTVLKKIEQKVRHGLVKYLPNKITCSKFVDFDNPSSPQKSIGNSNKQKGLASTKTKKEKLKESL